MGISEGRRPVEWAKFDLPSFFCHACVYGERDERWEKIHFRLALKASS